MRNRLDIHFRRSGCFCFDGQAARQLVVTGGNMRDKLYSGELSGTVFQVFRDGFGRIGEIRLAGTELVRYADECQEFIFNLLTNGGSVRTLVIEACDIQTMEIADVFARTMKEFSECFPEREVEL